MIVEMSPLGGNAVGVMGSSHRAYLEFNVSTFWKTGAPRKTTIAARAGLYEPELRGSEPPRCRSAHPSVRTPAADPKRDVSYHNHGKASKFHLNLQF